LNYQQISIETKKLRKILSVIEEFDVIVSTPLPALTKFPIKGAPGVFNIVNELKIPRIFFKMPLSYIRMNSQAFLSALSVAHSNYVAEFLKEGLVSRRLVNFVHPTYAKVFFHNENYIMSNVKDTMP
jgi:hypothetical protein